jgi:hypothetical protein
MMEWQPVESVPKDRLVDLWVERRCARTLSVVETRRVPAAVWMESFYWDGAFGKEEIGPCWVSQNRYPVERQSQGFAWVIVAWMEIPEGPTFPELSK